jgi:hypothetical protein
MSSDERVEELAELVNLAMHVHGPAYQHIDTFREAVCACVQKLQLHPMATMLILTTLLGEQLGVQMPRTVDTELMCDDIRDFLIEKIIATRRVLDQGER